MYVTLSWIAQIDLLEKINCGDRTPSTFFVNEIENTLIWRNEFSQRWISQPTEENKNRFGWFRKKVTQLIRHPTQSFWEKFLETNTTSRSICRPHKVFIKKSNYSTLSDPAKMNEDFATSGPLFFQKAMQDDDQKKRIEEWTAWLY